MKIKNEANVILALLIVLFCIMFFIFVWWEISPEFLNSRIPQDNLIGLVLRVLLFPITIIPCFTAIKIISKNIT